MKILIFVFGLIFQASSGHEIVRRNSRPISAKNICVTECTGKADNWQSYSNNTASVDGKYIQSFNRQYKNLNFS